MKKMFLFLIITTMLLSLISCSSSNEKKETGKEETPKSTQETGKEDTQKEEETSPTMADGELYEIVMTIPTLGTDPSGVQAVEDALNKEVEPALGVHVRLAPTSVSNLASENNLSITAGDKLDLMLCLFEPIGNYVSKGMLIELDELYEQYGADIKAAEGIAMAGGYFNGHLYCIPSEEKQARSYGYFARTDILKELGFEIDETALYTLEDLDKIFAAYKEKYGDGYYCVASARTITPEYIMPLDKLGASYNSGVLLGAGLDGNTTVENLYASDEYYSFAEHLYDWAQKGYISPDAATNTDQGAVQIASGYYLGSFSSTETDMKANMSRDCNYDMTVINLVAPYAVTSMYQSSSWAIPITCDNPEKTFQFLNYLYADNDLDTLLTYGLEGISYKVVEAGENSQAVIDYADGVDATNTPYNCALHVFGDKTSLRVWAPGTLEYYDVIKEFNANIPENRKSCTLGYVFDYTSFATEYSAVSSVIEQYTYSISSGAQNPKDSIPAFLSALESAGINTLIEENQKQLDAWLAEQK